MMRDCASRMLLVLTLVAVGLGAYLRLQQIELQWLTDDEWHAVHKILSGATYLEIARSVGGADFSIPQTLAYKWLAGHVGIDELGMRLPMLAGGILLVAGAAWWVWRVFGAWAALYCTTLLAISPLLIAFSRTARPYALTVLLACITVLALAEWRRAPRGGVLWLAGLGAFFACWLHMAVAPFVVVPIAALVVENCWQAWRQRRWCLSVPLLAMAAAVAVGVGLAAVLPMLLSRGALASRMGADLPTLETYLGVWSIWFGVSSNGLALALLVPACVGAVECWRRRPDVMVLFGLGLTCAMVGIYASRPAWVHNPLTFGRYLLPVLPFLLLWVALGGLRLGGALGWPGARLAVLGVLAAVLFVNAPTRDLLMRPNNFTLNYWYQFDYRPEYNPVRRLFEAFPESPFWRRLGEFEPQSKRIAVAGHGLESYSQLDVRWQPIHRQIVLNGQRMGLCDPPPYWGEVPEGSGFELRNAVSLASVAAMRAASLDYVVFKRNTSGMNVPDIEPCIARFREIHGVPAYEDAFLVAFDMKY